MHRIALVAFCLCLAPAALADIPVVDDAVLKAPCDEARTLDACPTCTCKLRTSTSPYPGLDERTSDIVIGAIVDVEASGPTATGHGARGADDQPRADRYLSFGPMLAFAGLDL